MTDVTPNEARMPEDAAVTVTSADTLRAMASPIRMRILGTLRVNGEQTVGSISEQLGEAPGAISYHLGQLAHAGLVQKRWSLLTEIEERAGGRPVKAPFVWEARRKEQ